MNKDTVYAILMCIVLFVFCVFAIRTGAIAEAESLQRNIKKFDCRESGITNLGRGANQKVYQCWDGRFHTAEELARL